MRTIKVVGLMSGTSVDGLDVALCEFYYSMGKWSYKVLKTQLVSYDISLRQSLLNASNLSGERLIILDAEFARFIGGVVLEFVNNCVVQVDLIASHGHTVFHKPKDSYTKQIGNGEIISKICGIPIVSDFRTGDVALGGQGAPLVPIGDMLLFSDYDACLNLGGFSNISFKTVSNDRIAYDISPVNIVLNELVRELNLEFDDKGEIARSGKLIEDLLMELNSIGFYKEKHPKSLSREWVELTIYPILDKYRENSIPDLLRTFTEHFAYIVANELNPDESVLITGGGAYNDYFIELVRKSSNANIIIPQKELIEFKEAVIFAFLGALRWFGEDNILSSVTGASRDSCSGVISLP